MNEVCPWPPWKPSSSAPPGLHFYWNPSLWPTPKPWSDHPHSPSQPSKPSLSPTSPPSPPPPWGQPCPRSSTWPSSPITLLLFHTAPHSTCHPHRGHRTLFRCYGTLLPLPPPPSSAPSPAWWFLPAPMPCPSLYAYMPNINSTYIFNTHTTYIFIAKLYKLISVYFSQI